MSSYNDEFIFTWIIENYFFNESRTGHCISSPCFKAENLCGSEWFIDFYPGECNQPPDFVSLNLFRPEDQNYESITINFKIDLCNTNNEVFVSVEEEGISFAGFDFYHIFDLISTKELEEKMRNTDEENLTLRCRRVRLKNDASESLMVMCCTAITEICFDVFSFLWLIYFESNWSLTKTFPINDETQLRINLRAPQEDFLFGIAQVGKDDFTTLRVKCEILLINDGEEKSLLCDVATFEEDDEETVFPTFLKKSLLDQKRCLYLKFNFSFANGSTFNKVIKETMQQNMPSPHQNSKKTSAMTYLTDDLNALLRDKKFADMCLRVESKKISVHKCILASRSPVLEAMINQNKLETDTGVIDITDMDIQTLTLFLEFLYTGEINDLNWERAMHLLLAAENYQVLSLKEKCSEYLEVRLTTENVCDVVTVADMVTDKDLKKISFDYIKENAEEVLSSQKWLAFVEENPKLCSEVLREKNLNPIGSKI